jgi:FtsH-binding integral membrane protein
MVAAGALLGVGAHLLNALPDLADDAKTGVHGLPHRLGAGKLRWLAPLVLLVASAVAAFGPLTRTAWVWAAFGLCVVLAVVAMRGRGRVPFAAAVGIAGLGVVMVRAVRERRRNIGVLRALGFQSGTIQRAFLTESTFVALEGIVLGAALSIVTSYLLFKNDQELNASGVGFPIPWASIAVLVAAAALASVLATVWPARQASKIRPAVALRIAD